MNSVLNTALYTVTRFFPILIKLRRYFIAASDILSTTKQTYSQHGEDRFVMDRLVDIDLSKGIYVDVGANQPTQISNTYLFYRAGGHGIAIEPNPQLERLYKRFRPRDIHLRIGCSNKPSVLPFSQTTSSVLAKFSDTGHRPVSAEYLPLLPLDNILEPLDFGFIYLLSIDVEGAEINVLQGAEKTLRKTIFVIIEDNMRERDIHSKLETYGFLEKTRLGPNIIFENESFLRHCYSISREGTS